jgi:prepilin-type processing-associated H-X9-DG protein
VSEIARAATFGGPPARGGATFLMADGSVRFVGNGTDPAVLRALAGPRE